ncbi:MAG: hypothetical protein ABSB84_13490 [Verrucomicrobiota bacterium]|jgi:hypothetical protein
MKPFHFLIIATLGAVVCQAEPPPASQPAGTLPTASPPTVTNTNEPANYVISVQWKDTKMGSRFLQVMTTEGSFNLDALEHSTMKINGPDIPTTFKLSGNLTLLGPEKGRLKLFIGRTVPYMTGASKGPGGTTPSSYQQLSVGLDSTFIVTFGKPLVIQGDENGQISILVKRDEG